MKTSPKFAIFLFGKSCAGKSTVEKVLNEKLPSVYNVGYDRLKWFLSNYHRDLHTALIKKLVGGFFEVVCKEGVPVILNSFFSVESEYVHCREVAERNGYTVFSVEMTAPTDVLLNRFRERLKSAKATGSKISVTNEELFLKNNARQFFVPAGTTTFDSSVMSPEEIAEQILQKVSVIS